jgi:hypothetical protein
MHAFLHNIMRGFVGTNFRAAVVSLPRSQVEMTDWDHQWQEKIVRVIGAVAKPLLVNNEAEIGEVIRRRLFENLGSERIRKNVAKEFADWCFERRAQLPPEWTAVDTATTEAKARDYLRSRFESCYPFHPATLSVFQRKWQALPQYQQTRGTLAMLAQWISWAHHDSFSKARREPLITLGSAPLDVLEFRSSVLGQLGETRLVAAIDADISGEQSHARALDADTTGPLRDIHRRVGTAILFESSGGQIDKVAHLPELRFALGEPQIDTTTIDNAAVALERRGYFIRPVGSDGFRIHHKPTLKKVVNDRRASLDETGEIKPTIRKMVEKEFRAGATMPIQPWPENSEAVPDSPRLTLVLMDPAVEWVGEGEVREQVAQWTKQRGKSNRLYPGSLLWCFKKPGRDLRDKAEQMLAWQRVAKEIGEGTLGADFDRTEKTDVQVEVEAARDAAVEEVWARYTILVLADSQEADGLKVIDMGAGHASTGGTLCGRIIAALKAEALLNESVGAGYIERNWPPALKASGTWPLASLRKSFLDGSLTRLLDPDAQLRSKIVEFVLNGDLGLASGQQADGSFERLYFDEMVPVDEVLFEPGVFLLTKAKAKALKEGKPDGAKPGTSAPEPATGPRGATSGGSAATGEVEPLPAHAGSSAESAPTTRTIEVAGTVPSELWNRLGQKLIPRLRTGKSLEIDVRFAATLPADSSQGIEADLRQILEDLGLQNQLRVERKD